MRIGFLMRRPERDAGSATQDTVRLLREWGATVDVIHLEEHLTRLTDVRPVHDLYVLRSVSDGTVSHAGVLNALGAIIVNPYAVTRTCRDKVVVTALLQNADVPVPETWVAEHPAQLASVLIGGPVVVKPAGSHGRGVQVVWDADELSEVVPHEGPLFAQRFQPRQGRDRKIYCIGDQLFGVKRVWPASTYEEKVGEPFTVTAELQDIASRVSAAIGTDLFGLDIVISRKQTYVVDVHPFPGFKGVPDSALRLADYIYSTAAHTLTALKARQSTPAAKR